MKAFLFMIGLGLVIGLVYPSGRSAPPPASAAATASVAPSETRLERSGSGHFYANADVNGQLVRFVVDTGASSVALTVDDARRIGIPFSPSEFSEIGSGASGPVRGKQILIDKVSLDGKEVAQVRGAILEGLDVSLLGQSYLSRIGAVEMRGDYMVLK